MWFCASCRNVITASTEEFLDSNAWCPRCCKVVRTTPCRVRMWVIAAVIVMAINVQVVGILARAGTP